MAQQFPSAFQNPSPVAQNQSNFSQQQQVPQQNFQNDYTQPNPLAGPACHQQVPYPFVPSASTVPPTLYRNWTSYPQSPFPEPRYAFLPQGILDQLHSCLTTTSSPIFILPNGCPNPPAANPTIVQPACIPYPLPMSFCHSEKQCRCRTRSPDSRADRVEHDSDCCLRMQANANFWKEHRCVESGDGAICTKKNCPASIQIQAIVSQLLGIPGIISSAITRMLLKKLPGSNVNESVEEIMEHAKRCLKEQNKEQLLAESRSNSEVKGLIGLYLTSTATIPKVIPILTNAQLKSNVLKALVESLINAKVIEDQGCFGAEAPETLDPMLLELKSDEDLRKLLANLRDKECEHRVNLNFSTYGPQRLVAESKLANIQRKINQIEKEMDRRYYQNV